MNTDRRKRDRGTPDRRREIIRDASPMAYSVALIGLAVALALAWIVG